MKRSKSRGGVRLVHVSADGAGVLSHAGVGLLREVADLSGLTEQVSAVLADKLTKGLLPYLTTPAGLPAGAVSRLLKPEGGLVCSAVSAC